MVIKPIPTNTIHENFLYKNSQILPKYNINPKQREKESLYKQTHKVRVDSTVETQALYFQLNLENFRRLN